MSYSRSSLTNSIFQLLLRNGGQTKYQLQRGLFTEFGIEVDTSLINSILYSQRYLFRRDNSSLPRWSVNQIDVLHSLNQIDKPPSLPSRVPPSVPLSIPNIYLGSSPRKWQIEAYQAWHQVGKRGIIEAVTGTGKTTVGIIAAAYAAEDNYDTLVLVPGLDLMEQWYKKLSNELPTLSIGKYGGGAKDTFEQHHIIVATVQSISRYPIRYTASGGLLIADEVHRYGTEKFSRALHEDFEHRLGLTATYERQDNGVEQYLQPYFMPSIREATNNPPEIVAGCNYARGLDDGILAPFKVGLIPVKFTFDEKKEYEELDENVRRLRSKLINQYECPAEPFGEFMKNVVTLSQGNNEYPQGTGYARHYLNLFRKRKALLAESRHKLKALEKLKKVFCSSKKALVFTSTKKSAKETAEKLSSMGIRASDFTSDLDKNERKNRLEEFKSGKIHILTAPKILDEGIDVPEADVGIIVSASSSRRQMIQRMGRIIRPKTDGRSATFIIFYVEDTSEDPELGAHEVFISEMVDIAEDVKYFSADVSPKKLLNWHQNS